MRQASTFGYAESHCASSSERYTAKDLASLGEEPRCFANTLRMTILKHFNRASAILMMRRDATQSAAAIAAAGPAGHRRAGDRYRRRPLPGQPLRRDRIDLPAGAGGGAEPSRCPAHAGAGGAS